MKGKIILLSLVAAVLSAGLVFAAGSKDPGASASGVQKVRVAHTQTYVPYDFINDKGESDGFEVAVLKAVDELIPDYEFEFVGTTDDDLLIGIESGKYGLGTKGAWITEERKKKYVIPRHNVAASIIGIVYRTENVNQIKDMESFAAFSGKLVPIAPQNAQYSIVEDYNATHPNNQVKLIPSEAFQISDAYTWVVEGRYDAFFDIKLSFQTTVADATGAWHRYADRLTYAPYKAIPTHALFNKKHQDLADKYDKAIEQLTADGTIRKLSEKYFGEDIFQYL
jgi:L-cystine transport system substrate-binding protein